MIMAMTTTMTMTMVKTMIMDQEHFTVNQLLILIEAF
jgi:hypothetical protein